MRIFVIFVSFLYIFLQCISANGTGQARELKGQAEKPKANQYKGCKWPKGPVGKIIYKDCKQLECIRVKNKFEWKETLRFSKCCLANGEAYPVGSVIMSNNSISLTCEKINEVPALRIITENMCPVETIATTTTTTTTTTSTTTTTTSTTTTTTTSSTTTTTITTSTSISSTETPILMTSVNTFTSPDYPSSYPSNIAKCWTQSPTDGHPLTLNFGDFDLHNSAIDSTSNWITISPSVGGRSKFWANSLSDPDAPPTTTTFATDQTVRVCFTALTSHGHKGFQAEFSDSTSTLPAISSIDLRGGPVPWQGNVFLNGKPVCDDGWNTNDAVVACSMLGYPHGVPTSNSRFGAIPFGSLMGNVSCGGSEKSLFDCSYEPNGNCNSDNGAGVICAPLQLRGGSFPSEGNLFVNGKTVCDAEWDAKDATVTCHMLGYSSGILTSNSRYGSVPSASFMDNVTCDGTEGSLFDCSYKKNDICDPNAGAGVMCATVQLQDGAVKSEGNLIVNGKPVCDDHWDTYDAMVACHMLGYTSGFPTSNSKFGSVSPVALMKNVTCEGSEDTLFDCIYTPNGNCSSSDGAGVMCATIELHNGSVPSEGTVFINGKPVCDDGWDTNDAIVLCHMLGYSSGVHKSNSTFGPIPLESFMDNVTCNGLETNIFDCSYKLNGNCSSDNGAGVKCATVELQGGSFASEGNVFVNGKPVCDDGWDDDATAVTCRMFGYASGVNKRNSKFGAIPSESFMDNVTCDGSEETLLDCGYELGGNCSSGAGVMCATVEFEGGTFPSEGNLIVNGKQVCDDGWNNNDAIVACRMLGYTSGVPTHNSTFGSVNLTSIMDNVTCDGSEETLFECSYEPNMNCSSGDGAGMKCATVELRDGSFPTEGNLFINGKPVCDDDWDINGAMVACHMLGYHKTLAHTNLSHFGQVPTDFIMDNINCTGTENSLFNCVFETENNCKAEEGAGVICLDMELRGGPLTNEGNIYFIGRPICDDSWDDNDGTVVCRMLGYSFGAATSSSKYGTVTTDFIMDDVNCDGSERTLSDCSYSSSHNCGTRNGAGVICYDMELLGGSISNEGNIYLNGQPICDDSWDNNDATVACRMLGYSSGTRTGGIYGAVPDDFIMDDVNCDGSEGTLFDCSYSTIDNCATTEGAGAICYDIELRGGSVNEGNVYLNGQPICDDAWDTNDATVTCRMLGYSSGTATGSSTYGAVPDDFIMDNVNCAGSEGTLFGCSYSPTDNCATTEGAGVICQGSRSLGGGALEMDGNKTSKMPEIN